jgi:dTDP-4-amino-4,6-dideoxygalactose transaminase
MGHDGPLIPIAKPWLLEDEAHAASRAILSGWVTQGPEVAAFEREFAAYVGAAHACAVANCTTALHLALVALDIGRGDEVIVPSHSFIATPNSVRYCGATPAFVDIEPETYNLDPRRVEEAVNDRTRAILCVHQVGMPCNLTSLATIASRHRLPLIEDAACATGSEILWNDAWERIGRPHGDIACFSFHPRKVVTTGDGGMITTSNPEWDAKFRLLRQHCMDVSDTVRHGSRRVVFESYPDVGFNYRMTDIQAAVGRAQLARLPEILERRRALAARYRVLLADLVELRLPHEPAWARSNWQSYCVRLPEDVQQRDVMQRMLNAGVATRRGVMCAHREEAYPSSTWTCGAANCGCVAGSCARLFESESAQDRCIMLPLYAQMTHADQERVVVALRDALRSTVHSG